MPDTTSQTNPADAAKASAQPGNAPEGTYGPHNSRIANALDPRVDSDLDTSKDAESASATGASSYSRDYPSTASHTTVDPTSTATKKQ